MTLTISIWPLVLFVWLAFSVGFLAGCFWAARGRFDDPV